MRRTLKAGVVVSSEELDGGFSVISPHSPSGLPAPRRLTRSICCSTVSDAAYHIDTRKPFSLAKRGARADIGMDESFELAVHGCAYGLRDVFV